MSQPSYDQIQNDFLRELAEIETESMGWIPLDGAYCQSPAPADKCFLSFIRLSLNPLATVCQGV